MGSRGEEKVPGTGAENPKKVEIGDGDSGVSPYFVATIDVPLEEARDSRRGSRRKGFLRVRIKNLRANERRNGDL